MTNESDRQFPFIAQPKPAPDAMREALQQIANLSLTSQAIPEVRRIVTEALSASVPPADGAKRCDCQNPGICAHEGRCIDKPLSPSGTIAAEPVASEFCERCNERLINSQNIFATKTGLVHFPKCPLIREDREAAVYTVLTKFLPKDATLDTLFQELKEALRDAR